jgi:hypothetical protein
MSRKFLQHVSSSSGSQTRSSRRDDNDEIERTQLMKSPKKKKMPGMLGDLFEF